MSSDLPKKPPSLDTLDHALRRFGIQVALLGDAIAGRLGMAETDLRCLCLIESEECVTAGEIAARIGLTSGAVTGLIDRLERAGFVERSRDPADRRRVIVRLTSEVDRRLGPVFAHMRESMAELWAGLDEAALAVLSDFFRRSQPIFHAQQIRIRAEADGVGDDPPPR